MMDISDDARVISPGIIKVIGIGQSLRGDDAAGLAAVRLWQETYQIMPAHPGMLVELAELPGIGLLDLFEGAQAVILVDAVQSGATPGTIHLLGEEELAAFTEGSGSAHGWGLAETILLGRQIKPASLPKKLLIIGIEVGQLNLGEILSPEVQSALPEAIRLIEQYIVMVMTSSQA